ncbi:RapZ C-terminal domain-containing protein [Amycolatopsis minnesotensis]|uniref:RapZ C-terminal domain-containing protein n=1 Tax=Amycolatopsis minnesotensis TaxID=337894 RepID=A0ABN2SIA5_9PSEU
MSARIQVVSFGYGHHDDPAADITVDIRRRVYDPHLAPELRHLTGLDSEIRDRVADFPGVRGLVGDAFRMAVSLAGLGAESVTVAFGCVGGRHRSVVLAELLHLRAVAAGWVTGVEHRHIDRPVLPRKEDP